MKGLLVILLSVLLLACSVPVTKQASSPPRCAELLMQAQVTPLKPVPGVWDCLSNGMQKGLEAQGSTGDGAFAGPTEYNMKYEYVGREKTGSGYVYLVRAIKGNTELVITFVIYLNQSGKVYVQLNTDPIQIGA